MAEPKMEVKKKRGVHLKVKDEHLIRAHELFVNGILKPVNNELIKKGVIKQPNNPLATKVLADGLIPYIKDLDIDLSVNIKKKMKKIRFRI